MNLLKWCKEKNHHPLICTGFFLYLTYFFGVPLHNTSAFFCIAMVSKHWVTEVKTKYLQLPRLQEGGCLLIFISEKTNWNDSYTNLNKQGGGSVSTKWMWHSLLLFLSDTFGNFGLFYKCGVLNLYGIPAANYTTLLICNPETCELNVESLPGLG